MNDYDRRADLQGALHAPKLQRADLDDLAARPAVRDAMGRMLLALRLTMRDTPTRATVRRDLDEARSRPRDPRELAADRHTHDEALAVGLVREIQRCIGLMTDAGLDNLTAEYNDKLASLLNGENDR